MAKYKDPEFHDDNTVELDIPSEWQRPGGTPEPTTDEGAE